MPLPEGSSNTAWPPAPFDTALKQIAVHDAWWVGDGDALQRTYTSSNVVANRPSQTRGGVVGAVARFFWGRATPAGQQRTRLHVPVAADIATTSADLLFSEPPRILLPKGDDGKTAHPTQDRLEAIMNSAVVHSSLLEAAEMGAAHGGTYLRIVWDAEVAEHPILQGVAEDCAIPEWKFGRLRAVTFWTVVKTNGQQIWRHLERHEPGRIEHGLYQGTATHLGQRVPLTEADATASLPVDADSAIITGTDELTAAFVPNMLPQRRWRKITELAPLGRSDFDGVEGIFDAIDETYSSWMRDIRLGKARLVVDQAMLDPQGPGGGATFDDDQELYTALPGGVGSLADGTNMLAHQFAIRWEEHQRTIQDLLRAALRAAGYSPASLGDDSVSVQETATQVKSKERLSDRTRDKKIRYWKAALEHMSKAILEVDAAVFGANQYDGQLPEVRFPEKVQQDVLELAQTVETLDRARAISTKLKVRMMHPDWEAEEIDDEAAAIMAEQSVADPFAAVEPVVPTPPAAEDTEDEE